MQIYNDQLYDLLTDEKDGKGNFKALPIRESTMANKEVSERSEASVLCGRRAYSR